MPQVSSQFPSTYQLSNLNGQTGFQLQGENANDWSGYAVSIAGDVNDDGISDLIIGAPKANSNAGAAYVVFGHTGNFADSFDLSSLNGLNGAKFTGENTGDQAGFYVSDAGDVNGDGIDDFLISSPQVNSAAGASYLIFGHTGTWTTPLSLSSLNGLNGVKLTGESLGDQSGTSASGAGDINSDGISDFVIGAVAVNSYTGASYLVFGHTSSWTSPMSLSTLNGANGVKFPGENTNDNAGISVDSAGDINNDGVNDLIIGAYLASSFAGASYVVFGHTGSWTTPFSLSTLSGVNGMKFLGNAGDRSGVSVSGVGDFNGDGVSDLIIGASYTNSGSGMSYVVFGHGSSWVTPISLSSLDGVIGVKFPGENAGDRSGYSVSGVGDINDDGVSDSCHWSLGCQFGLYYFRS